MLKLLIAAALFVAMIAIVIHVDPANAAGGHAAAGHSHASKTANDHDADD